MTDNMKQQPHYEEALEITEIPQLFKLHSSDCVK